MEGLKEMKDKKMFHTKKVVKQAENKMSNFQLFSFV